VSANLYCNAEILGQFGDFTGGILNPVFSLLSLILILMSLFYAHFNNELTMQGQKIAMGAIEIQLQQLRFETEKHKTELSDSQKKSKQDLTIMWHQNWMSPQMSLLKANVFGEIQTRILNIEAGQASAFIGGLRNAGAFHIRKTYNEIKGVMRFFQQAITFFEEELVDKRLFLRLFETEFRQWHTVLSRLDMRINNDDFAKESLLEETERIELIERLGKVIGSVASL
jgi:hypothetical protein